MMKRMSKAFFITCALTAASQWPEVLDVTEGEGILGYFFRFLIGAVIMSFVCFGWCQEDKK